jgi:hypothetical protein
MFTELFNQFFGRTRTVAGISSIIMDRSSSMDRYGDMPHRALTEHVEGLKSIPREHQPEVMITLFDREAEILVPQKPVRKIRKVPQYKNGNGTRLHETIAETLEHLIAQAKKDQQQGFLRLISLAVFTDGFDTTKPAGAHLDRLHSLVVESQGFTFQLIAVGIGRSGITLAEELWFPPRLAMTVKEDGLELVKTTLSITSALSQSISLAASGIPNPPELPSMPKNPADKYSAPSENFELPGTKRSKPTRKRAPRTKKAKSP